MTSNEDFEELIKNLQKKIDLEEEKTYSKKVIEEYRNPTFFGLLNNPDASAKIKGSCRDTMKFDLKLKDNTITKIGFWTDGCGASIACGNMLSKLSIGKKLSEAEKITKEKLLTELDDLPPEHEHCSKLSVDTLHKCIKNYKKRSKL